MHISEDFYNTAGALLAGVALGWFVTQIGIPAMARKHVANVTHCIETSMGAKIEPQIPIPENVWRACTTRFGL